jgi:23S rRNA (uracil1939-C5)-methyltransferase
MVLTAEKPVSGGWMLARHDGQIVFVSGAIPGERIKVRVDRVARQLAYASTIEVIDPSADRREPFIDAACGGSVYSHISYQRQVTLKAELVNDALARIAKVVWRQSVPVAASREDGYRMRARLHVRNGRIGFFREGTHELCDAAATRQLLPGTLEGVASLVESFQSSHARTIVSCEVTENVAGDERAVVAELEDGRGEILAGPAVTERLSVHGAHLTLTHDVRSFFQGNRWLLPTLIEAVTTQVPAGSVVDLYAGVGLFAVSLAAMGRTNITAVEGDRSSASDLEDNAAPYLSALDVQHQSVEQYLRSARPQTSDVVILDPPRTGISNDAMVGVLRLRAPRIVYVSCDLATLARDVRRMLDRGYQLRHIEAFDLFPNTAHVETLAILEL